MSFFGGLLSGVGDFFTGNWSGIPGDISSALDSKSSDSSIGSLISGGASLLGGLNQQSAAADQVRQQEQFQEEMSNTAHQREVKDLVAAGLNPVLSATHGGASTPSGAMFNPSNILGGATTSAMQGFTLEKQKELLEAQVDQAKSVSEKAANDALVSGYEATRQGFLMPYWRSTAAATAAQANAEKAQADFTANLFEKHPDMMMSEEILRGIVSPITNSAATAVGALPGGGRWSPLGPNGAFNSSTGEIIGGR